MTSDRDITLKANKILLFTKGALSTTGYIVYVKNDGLDLYNVMLKASNEYGLAGKHKIENRYKMDMMISLFIKKYQIKIIKDRDLFQIKDSVLDKYGRLLKRYYKKSNNDLNYIFERFLYNYLHSNEAGMRMNMHSINELIEEFV